MSWSPQPPNCDPISRRTHRRSQTRRLGGRHQLDQRPERVGTIDRIRIECEVTDDEITVFIHDRGQGFDRGDVPELPEPDHPDRLLHEWSRPPSDGLTDETEVSSDDAGTDVKLVVYSSNRRRLG